MDNGITENRRTPSRLKHPVLTDLLSARGALISSRVMQYSRREEERQAFGMRREKLQYALHDLYAG